MTSRRARITSVSALLAATVLLIGVLMPASTAEEIKIKVEIVPGHQPRDASVDALITAGPFDTTGSSGVVKVKVTSAGGPVVGAEVTFVLAEGPGLASGALSVTPRVTDGQGVAFFDDGLSIADANEPFLTSYRLIPIGTVTAGGEGSTKAGAASDPFDIWDTGCHGTGCVIGLRGGLDEYTTTEDVGMGASIVPVASIEISCTGQKVIFASDVFFHATTGSGPVFLVNHITAADLQAAPPTAGKRGWCVGLKAPDAWIRNGAPYTVQDMNGSASGGILYVAMAPKCLKPNPSSYAPCWVTQTSDNAGGGFITGWLPGGDPPRRT